MKNHLNTSILAFLIGISFSCIKSDKKGSSLVKSTPINKEIYAQNEEEITKGKSKIVIMGATLIDGNGKAPVPNSLVVINKNIIEFVGEVGDVEIAETMTIVDASGQTLVPGFIDAHYHNEYDTIMLPKYLARGVTTVRDPGAWMDFYDPVRATGKSIPRLFLTGPHIDTYPPAHPTNSFLIKDDIEARSIVNRLADQGATAIKVYYGLSIGMIKAVCETAHERGLPVTAHLEISNARDAILAGLDGIEHVTSLGLSLLPMRKAEDYKNLIMNDNEARERGRYEAWNSIDINDETSDELIQIMADQKTFLSPTLAVFEKQYDAGDSIEVNGFENMVQFVGKAKNGGVRIVVGSHTWVPYAEDGAGYYREMELLKKAGLTNMEILVSSTMENARFFRIDQYLGSIEEGKLADLILLENDPLKDLGAVRESKKVMLNGVFMEQ